MAGSERQKSTLAGIGELAQSGKGGLPALPPHHPACASAPAGSRQGSTGSPLAQWEPRPSAHRPCRVLHSDARCPPRLIVEVLSASTEKWDTITKRVADQSLSSLQEYVVVAQDRREIQVYRRAGDTWDLETYAQGDAVWLRSDCACRWRRSMKALEALRRKR
jgi:hypothetical protein